MNPCRFVLACIGMLLASRIELSAQCTPFGFGCPGGGQLSCATPPQIGTTWLLCQVPTCPTNKLMLLGNCSSTPFHFTQPPACATCPSCYLDLVPVYVSVFWSGLGCLGLPIPNNLGLIGGVFCVQNVCTGMQGTNTCICLSTTMRVTLFR